MLALPLRLEEATKDYGDLRAVDRLCLEVHAGEIVGLLGPNGAGKSTTLGVALGLIRPSAGRAILFGSDPRQAPARQRCGTLLEGSALPLGLSPVEAVHHLGALGGPVDRGRVADLLELLGLSRVRHQRIGTLSLGTRRRCALALALLHRPALLILDEPTAGLDPQAMRDVRDLVRDLARREGTAVLWASHFLPEVEALCDRVTILRRGRCLAEGRPQDLLPPSETVAVLRVAPLEEAAWALVGEEWVEAVRQQGPEIVVALLEGSIPDLVAYLCAKGFRVAEVTRRRESLEEFFLRITAKGESSRRGAAPRGIEGGCS